MEDRLQFIYKKRVIRERFRIIRERFRNWFISRNSKSVIRKPERLRLALHFEVDVEYIEKWILSEQRKSKRILNGRSKDPSKALRAEKLKFFFHHKSFFPSEKQISDLSLELKCSEQKIKMWFLRNRCLKKKKEMKNALNI